MNAGLILGRLSPYRAQEYKIRDEQSTGDIISAITKAHYQYQPEYKKIALFFKESTPRQTGKKIFDFLKNNVRYEIEPSDKQTVKSPSAIMAEGFGDCKHYASWAGGCLQQLGIPFAYRFASYRLFDKTPQHVFVVINPGTQNEIWIDPVLSTYDYKKTYTYAKDKNMALYQVSGIGATAAQKERLRLAKATKKSAKGAEKKVAKKEVKAARKAAGRTLANTLIKGSKVILKVSAAPVRNAFLLLVKLNFGNLANKLKNAWEKAPSKVREFWERAGGKIESLKKTWESGSKKKRIFGIGVVQAAAAAPVVAAPLIVKVVDLLKSIGIKPDDLVQIGKDALNEKAQQLANKVLQPQAAQEAANIETAAEATDQAETETLAPETTTTTAGKNMLPLILGGAAILYFVTRKK